jgi:circadian clock protein KaiC
MPPASRSKHPQPLSKAATGIAGFDELTAGGVPRGRPTLICGGAGCGKTVFAMQFLLNGAERYQEPGVFVSFEEPTQELTTNLASIGYDIPALVRRKKIIVDHVHLERSEIVETGDFDLDGLFIRLEHAVSSIGAKRIVLDTLEVLFAALSNEGVIRAELRRLFRWLKDKGLTAIITGEQGSGTLTRHGIEEYVSDCVVVLDNRVADQISTRRMRIVKYRGSPHATNEIPFLITQDGISVLPISSIGMSNKVSSQRVSSGIPDLDAMLGHKGFLRGTSILVSGTAGTGKSSVGASFAVAACQRGERCLLFAFEESAAQIVRNMRSIGIDLQKYIDRGLLRIHAARSTTYGLEMHLVQIIAMIADFRPAAAVIDPVSNFVATGMATDVKAMLARVIDVAKSSGITALFTSLTFSTSEHESTETHISSLMDTWILLRSAELDGERVRLMAVLKSRGMEHSNQIREFLISRKGLTTLPIHRGKTGVLLGTARLADLDAQSGRSLLTNGHLSR